MTRALLAMTVLLALTPFARAQDPQSYSGIERGRYLAILADCAACHTAPGGKPFAGGLPLKTPFGVIVSSNITPDPDYGIGRMSNDQFYDVLHKGIGPDGLHLYPAMPYPAYTKIPRQDVDDIYTFLMTVEPAHERVVSDQLPFPFSIRASMLVWNWLNFTEGGFRSNPQQSADWNRGAYLVDGPGHCGTCHTPKNFMGADEDAHNLEGASLQGWFAPNITGDPHSASAGGPKTISCNISRPARTGTRSRQARCRRRSSTPAPACSGVTLRQSPPI